MLSIQDEDRIQVSPCGKTVWVHADDGSTVGRFSKVFGMDVHRTITEQMAGAQQCLRCTHEAPGPAEWAEFCDLMQQHYGITVDRAVLNFEKGDAMAQKPENINDMRARPSNAKKLTEAQKRVMKWIGKGWTTEPGPGSSVKVNGARICNVDTMMSLQRMGLAVKDERNCWAATSAGKELTMELGL